LTWGWTKLKQCRVCKGPNLHKFLSLGDQPHCNHFLRKDELNSQETSYPLDVYFCDDCALVQLGFVVPPEFMFREYPYLSGTTNTLPEHFRRLAADSVQRLGIPPGALVVDIGSNDGTFLRGFKDLGMTVLGVDPAVNIAKIANESGIETLPEFFGQEIASGIVAQRGNAQLVTAAGVFYHLPNLDDVVEGVYTLLEDDGVFVVQANYLLDMLEKNSFDNIYHEHLCYYALKPLTALFSRFNMEVVDVERHSIHGGSIILYVKKGITSTPKPRVEALLREEERLGVYSLDTYHEFANKVREIKGQLVSLLNGLKAKGHTIAAYGAPAKGNTMLNYCEIGPDILEYAAEKNSLKVGFYTPGMHIPVVHEEEVRGNPPDYYLVLPWNFLDEFLEKEKPFRDNGGKFIVPIPEPYII